ncbi:MAG: hypothetical protein LBP63_00585 [Prevotellaceae bacterium]|nr:hypothetical protein [Prevotellaceae bacterium]
MENIVFSGKVLLADKITSTNIDFKKYMNINMYISVLLTKQIESILAYHLGDTNCEKLSKLETKSLELKDMNIIVLKDTNLMNFQIEKIKLHYDSCKLHAQATDLLFISSNWSEKVSLDSAIYETKFQFDMAKNDSLLHQNFVNCFSESFQYVENAAISIKPLTICE